MRGLMLGVGVTVLVIAGGTACGAPTYFVERGFQHPHFGYGVDYGSPSRLVSPDWVVDNFYRRGGDIVPKGGPDYETTLFLDLNGDGTHDYQRTLNIYDLRLRHRNGAGVLWVRSIPLDHRYAETELRVLARLYVDAVSGDGLVVTQVGAGRVHTTRRRFATRILDERAVAVHGHEGFEVTFEMADVDQIELSAESRWERARAVFIRPGHLWRPTSSSGYALPVIMVVGYSNLPEDFAGGGGRSAQAPCHVALAR